MRKKAATSSRLAITLMAAGTLLGSPTGLALAGEIAGRFDPSGVEWPGLEEADPDVGLVVGLTRMLRGPGPRPR